MSASDKLVSDYLERVERASRDLPGARRRELVDELAAHIAEARAEGDEGEAAIRNVLERLGDPEELAAEERARLGIEPAEAGSREVWALVMLSIGSLVLPVFGWIIGVVLLWGSRVWTTGEKLIGTLFVPGGLLPSVFVLQRSVDPAGDEDSAAETVLGIALLVLPFLVIAAVTFLAIRMRQRTRTVQDWPQETGVV